MIAQTIFVENIVWDDVLLTSVRLTILAASSWGTKVLWTILRRSPGNVSVVLLPRAVVKFTMFWLVASALMSLLLILTDADAVIGPTRTLYGVSLGWTIFGLVWLLSIGARGSQGALEVFEKLQNVKSDDRTQ